MFKKDTGTNGTALSELPTVAELEKKLEEATRAAEAARTESYAADRNRDMVVAVYRAGPGGRRALTQADVVAARERAREAEAAFVAASRKQAAAGRRIYLRHCLSAAYSEFQHSLEEQR